MLSNYVYLILFTVFGIRVNAHGLGALFGRRLNNGRMKMAVMALYREARFLPLLYSLSLV